MDDPERGLKDILEKLHDEIALLKRRVENLENQVARASEPVLETLQHAGDVNTGERADLSGTWSEGAMANVMSRGAAISLILLVALVLRALTDSGVVALGTGTFLGVGYATLLEAAGLLMYRSRSPFAAIFSVSGILLLVAVILEAHAAFSAIPTAPAYALMVAAAGGMTIMSHVYRVALPACIGIIAVLLAGVPLDFPEPDFAALAVFLAAVNVMAFTVMRLPRCRWLRMVAFAFTASTLLLWAVKLSASIRMGLSSPADKLWFFALTIIFFMFYTGASVLAVWRSAQSERDIFTNILPTAASVLAYMTSLTVVLASGTGQRSLGIAGMGTATFLLCIAALRAMEPMNPPRGINTFAFPAAFLLALSFRDVSGKSVVALAILSWAALSLAWLSSRWSSEGVRVTSYFLQALVLGASSLLLMRNPSGELPAAVTLSMAFTGLVAFLHYVLVRRNPPARQTVYFSQFDKKDLSGMVPLVVSAGAVFLALRSVIFVSLKGDGQTFQAAETAVVSLGAFTLFAAAWFRKNAEFKWVAAFITILGGGKVFLYDLFKIKGVPVLFSFLAFASAASMGSLILKRWPRQDGP